MLISVFILKVNVATVTNNLCKFLNLQRRYAVCCLHINRTMRNKQKILIATITSAVAFGLAVLIIGQTKKVKLYKRLDRIADEGYETAGDILFPKKKLWKKRDLFETDFSSKDPFPYGV